jgi:hypothetical protein
MDFDNALTGNTGRIVQTVDVLGDDMRDVATSDEFRYREVTRSRLGCADGFMDHQKTPPSLEPGFLRGEKFAEGDGLVAGPEAAWRAKIRYP